MSPLVAMNEARPGCEVHGRGEFACEELAQELDHAVGDDPAGHEEFLTVEKQDGPSAGVRIAGQPAQERWLPEGNGPRISIWPIASSEVIEPTPYTDMNAM